MRPVSVQRFVGGYLQHAKSVVADAFDYVLPAASIAQRPLPNRSASKLLLVEGPELSMRSKKFTDLPELLPPDSLIVRNSSRVIPARLLMQKETGGRAEVMLLSPVGHIDPSQALTSNDLRTPWNCYVGGRRIKCGDTLFAKLGSSGASERCYLAAHVRQREGQNAVVHFSIRKNSGAPVEQSCSANDAFTLRDAIEDIGRTPLPPYIRREDDVLDKETYQTIYANREGSVAAPTAGLHLTDEVIAAVQAKGMQFADVLLHVGAGTFAPLGGPLAGDHSMHEERTSVLRAELRRIVSHVKVGRPIVALGTTSVRTLESLYWMGVHILMSSTHKTGSVFCVGQWDPYHWLDEIGPGGLPSVTEALDAVLEVQLSESAEVLCNTRLLIVPGYPFQLVHGLITNFHQPRSTLLMLVSAFIGENGDISEIYKYALANDYRFLSYGDSSLLLPFKDIFDKDRR